MSFKDFLDKAKKYIDNSKIRQWIDGDEDASGVEKGFEKPSKNEVEEFLAQISRTISNLMLMKKFVIANGRVFLPDHYIVFLSPQKDKEFQGRMREMFLEGLQCLGEEAASEIVGKSSINQIPIKVELRVDGTLMSSSLDYRVQVFDGKTGKTETFESHSKIEDEETIVQIDEEKTIVDPEATIVEWKKTQTFTKTLYRIDISFQGAFEKEVSINKPQIKIGRPSRSSDVDIELPNGKVSRRHATLDLDNAGNIWLTHKGQNQTKVNGLSCNFEEKRLVKPGQKIEIEDYVLVIKT